MKFVSIDPGLRGAIVFWEEGVPVRYELMPLNGNEISLAAIAKILQGQSAIALEKVGGLPGQSAPAAFSFGAQVGQICGIAYALGLQRHEYRPQAWQKIAHAGLPAKMEPKARSRAAASRFFPSFNVIPEGCRVQHDGVCDALLIGYAHLRRHNEAK